MIDGKNVTRISTILLLGFHSPQSLKYWVFFMFLMIYCVTLCGNLLIISLVVYSEFLHSPMYFFLSQLSISDILLITDVLPNMLHVLLTEKSTMSFSDCIAQLYFFGVAGMLECLLLTVMSYDRYLAICKPLHYHLIMNFQHCWKMIIASWTSILCATSPSIVSILMTQQFCGPNVIDHIFCDLDPILKLSCSDTSTLRTVFSLVSGTYVFIPFCIIIISYVYIIVAIFQIPSVTGRKKVFSTCSSHLTAVCIYFGTLFSVYLVPNRGQSWNVSKFLSLFYTVITPLMNPIIYSLRNKDFKKAIEKIFKFYANSLKH